MGDQQEGPTRPAVTSRKCLKCRKPFKSTGDRICKGCNRDNARLSRQEGRTCQDPYCDLDLD